MGFDMENSSAKATVHIAADVYTPVVPASPAPTASNKTQTAKALAPSPPKQVAFDPAFNLLSRNITDPLYKQIRFGWSDRQQHGRLVYDSMMKHAAVAGPMNTLIAFLKAYKPIFKPSVPDATPRQQELADFANEQLRRLGSSGDARHGYEKFIEWFGQGLRYGFSLAEMSTTYAAWRGQSRVQIKCLYPLPQSSLDSGYQPLEEYGHTINTQGIDVRYRCFDLDDKGSIRAFLQYYRAGNTLNEVRWEGADKLRILHYAHGGGEGNPFGESILFTPFYHWASLYTLEQMEEAFLDASLPYLTASYKTPDGRPSPEIHAQFLEVIKQQDPSVRALIMPDTTFGSTAPSNPAFTEHAKQKKLELRAYIKSCIFGAHLAEQMSNELDARNVIQVFFKYFVPALQREISTVITWQFAKRLIDANWSGLNDVDYPVLDFQNTLDNDLRVALPLIQQLLPLMDSNRLGEVAETLVNGMDASWFPKDHADSVAEQRTAPDPAQSGKPMPPTKQPGAIAQNHTGQTSNPSGSVDTAV